MVYAEVRNAPELNTQQGMTMLEVLEATDRGLARGMQAAQAQGHTIVVNQLVCGMRQDSRVFEAAEAALEARDSGLHVVGFDIGAVRAESALLKAAAMIPIVKKTRMVLPKMPEVQNMGRMSSPEAGNVIPCCAASVINKTPRQRNKKLIGVKARP